MADFSSEANCRVFVRVRALNAIEKAAGRSQVVQVQQNALFIGPPQAQKQMTFDWIAGPDAPQASIFETVGRPMVDACLTGYNGTIFAYGQTGSGKTFTMQGLVEMGQLVQEHRGLMPRTFEYVFQKMNKLTTVEQNYVCKCSFLEIYNEKITDLLNVNNGSLNLRETFNQGVYVDGLTECVVESTEECLKYMEIGAKNRQVRQTAKNHQSSRSHSIFTLYIQSIERRGGIQSVKASRLHLVDLAGSERQKETQTSGTALKEASNINKALLTLGSVIRGLVDQQQGEQRHIHYRDSKLTYLLKDSLGGNSKTSIITTISSASDCLAESLSTLQFAQRAKMIKNEAVVNETESIAAANELKEEVERLRALLQSSQSNERFAEIEQEKQSLQEINDTLSKTLDEARVVDAEKEQKLRTQKTKIKALGAQLKEAKDQTFAMARHVDDFKVGSKRDKEVMSEAITKLQGQIQQLEESKALAIQMADDKAAKIDDARKLLDQELSAVISCLEEERTKRQEAELFLAQLKQSVQQKTAELAVVQAELSKHIGQIQHVTTDLQTATSSLASSNERIAELEQYIERLSSEFDELAGETSRLESELTSAEEGKQQIQTDLDAALAEASERTQQLLSLQEQLDSETASFQNELLECKVVIAQSEDRVRSLSEENLKITSAIAEVQKALNVEAEQLDHTRMELAYVADVTFPLREIVSHSPISKMIELRDELASKNARLDSEVTQLKVVLGQRDGDINHWRTLFTERNEELIETRQKVEESLSLIREQEGEIETLLAEQEMLVEECEEMRSVTKEVKKQNEALEQNLASAENKNDSLRKALAGEQSTVAQLNFESKYWQDLFEVSETEKKEVTKTLEKNLQTEKEALELKLKELAYEKDLADEVLRTERQQREEERTLLTQRLDAEIAEGSALEEEKTKLESDLATATANVERLTKASEILNEQVNCSMDLCNLQQTQLETALSDVAKKDVEMQKMQQILDQAVLTVNELNTQKAQLEETLNSASSTVHVENADLKRKLVALTESSEQTQKDLAETKQHLGDVSSERTQLAGQVTELNQRLVTADNEREGLRQLVDKMETLQSDFDLMHAELTELEGVKSEHEKATAELSALKIQLTAMEESNASIAALRDEFDIERQALREALEQSSNELDIVRSQLNAEHEEQVALREQAKLDLDSVVAEKMQLEAQLKQLQADGAESDKKLKETREENAARQMLSSVEVERIEKENAKFKIALQGLHNDFKAAVERADTNGSQLNIMKKAYAELHLKHTSLTDQHGSLQKSHAQLDKDHADLCKKFSSVELQLHQLEIELSASKKQAQQWDRFDMQHKMTGEKFQQQFELVVQRADTFRKEKESLQAQLATQGRHLSDIEIEKEKLLSDNAKLRNQLELMGLGGADYMDGFFGSRGQESSGFSALKSIIKPSGAPVALASQPVASSAAPAPVVAKTPSAFTPGNAFTAQAEPLQPKNDDASKMPPPTMRFSSLRRRNQENAASGIKEKENM